MTACLTSSPRFLPIREKVYTEEFIIQLTFLGSKGCGTSGLETSWT